MVNERTQYYPEHDRTSCSDEDACNAEAGGSHGCARCTAILLDERDALAERCERLEAALRMAREELGGLPHSLGYDFTHLPKIDAALSGSSGGKDG